MEAQCNYGLSWNGNEADGDRGGKGVSAEQDITGRSLVHAGLTLPGDVQRFVNLQDSQGSPSNRPNHSSKITLFLFILT